MQVTLHGAMSGTKATCQLLLLPEAIRILTAGAYYPAGLDLSYQAVSVERNQEHVNDTAKLMIHLLIAQAMGRDPSLLEKAKTRLDRNARHFEGYLFVREWSELPALSPSEIRYLLTSRIETMTRLLLSSPFVLAESIDFGSPELRRRIWRAAKRIARRSPGFAGMPPANA